MMDARAVELAEFRTAVAVEGAGHLLLLVAGGLAILFVHRPTAMQTAKQGVTAGR
ncbi:MULTISPECIES: hypothetical protein [unclassified Streptomyces]|uniref:hypothetical protein n=1 Tax=unclassified Streptomyces TaxID=2593676 RepID=UPI002258EFF3|nr:hypothetical protein [Streptomyces sp. NBC_01551]MCX4524464.1 hypothetical protein [Streptomyces sp. NBC_01551]